MDCIRLSILEGGEDIIKMRESWLERDTSTNCDKVSVKPHHIGTVNLVEDLPWSAEVGEVYGVRQDYSDYMWNGNEWVVIDSGERVARRIHCMDEIMDDFYRSIGPFISWL